MKNPKLLWATLGLASILLIVLRLVLGEWQSWFPGLWFVALVAVLLWDSRPRRRRAPDPEA